MFKFAQNMFQKSRIFPNFDICPVKVIIYKVYNILDIFGFELSLQTHVMPLIGPIFKDY